MNRFRALSFTLCLVAAFSQTACLKTRSQIRGNDRDVEEIPANEAKASSAKASAYEVEELKGELVRLNGRLEELDHASRSNNPAEVREALGKLDARIGELEKNQVLVMTELKAIKDKEETKARTASVPTGDLLGQAKELLSQKRFEEATEKFNQVLSRSTKGKDAAEAYYGLGEVRYAQKEYKEAILEYNKVQDAHAKSNRVASSLYRMGLSFQHLNRTKEAKGFFDELAERFPKSPEAKKIRGKVKE